MVVDQLQKCSLLSYDVHPCIYISIFATSSPKCRTIGLTTSMFCATSRRVIADRAFTLAMNPLAANTHTTSLFCHSATIACTCEAFAIAWYRCTLKPNAMSRGSIAIALGSWCTLPTHLPQRFRALTKQSLRCHPAEYLEHTLHNTGVIGKWGVVVWGCQTWFSNRSSNKTSTIFKMCSMFEARSKKRVTIRSSGQAKTEAREEPNGYKYKVLV